MPRFSVRPAVLVAWVVLVAACTGGAGGGGGGALEPAALAALEAQRAARPDDPVLQLRLARAYYAAQRYADARRAIDVVRRVQPDNVEAEAYSGLLFEALAHYDSARTAYSRLLAGRPPRRVERLLNGRLTLLARKELIAAARLALARESLLAVSAPDPNAVAVMPFRYTGRDSTLRPLERGLAALVVTDLSRVRRLKLVERERLQALLDELQLAASGRVDPATGARSGRLAGAAQVVQGQFQEVPTANVRIDAAVVRSSDAGVAATGTSSDQLRALFDIEKAVVFQLLERMGIQLTPAERTAISERPTRDIQAFVLYSRGLEAQDRGDLAGAARSFQAAVQRDPGFAAAAQQAGQSQAAADAAATPPAELAAVAGGGGGEGGGAGAGNAGDALRVAINDVVPTGVATIDAVGTTLAPLPPSDPNRICEANACAGPQQLAFIGTIIIRLPIK